MSTPWSVELDKSNVVCLDEIVEVTVGVLEDGSSSAGESQEGGDQSCLDPTHYLERRIGLEGDLWGMGTRKLASEDQNFGILA
ncbi:hypothetical protein GCK72_000241 [Caenorhabditis remanei]|uniref:Uncharacterized protein n=1 Tax=Caenorhabditis remanei TaxID=31234 RepID=A0A6A5HLK8_CAERE|nr:hypothetical protein GCK72_000241 [Caenorhabditis remanei]KAF1768429.1 hypothetical protein GCK72_000241 [Caenorhabditis remanei]